MKCTQTSEHEFCLCISYLCIGILYPYKSMWQWANCNCVQCTLIVFSLSGRGQVQSICIAGFYPQFVWKNPRLLPLTMHAQMYEWMHASILCMITFWMPPSHSWFDLWSVWVYVCMRISGASDDSYRILFGFFFLNYVIHIMAFILFFDKFHSEGELIWTSNARFSP